jgi:hypothetical protein
MSKEYGGHWRQGSGTSTQGWLESKGRLMRRWKGLVVAAVVALLAPVGVSAEEVVLTLLPEKTRMTFTVKATVFDIDAALALNSGQIRFDPDTGKQVTNSITPITPVTK